MGFDWVQQEQDMCNFRALGINDTLLNEQSAL